MKRSLSLLFLVASFIMMITLEGCNHKDLLADYSGTSQVNMLYDWSRATGNPDPAHVDLYLYPGQGGAPNYQQTPKTGVTLVLPADTYTGFAFATDSGSLQINDTGNKDACTITTKDEDILAPLGQPSGSVPRPAGTENERVAMTPDPAWAGHTDGFTVPGTDEELTHTIYMEDLYVTYHVTVSDVNGIEALKAVSGALTGLAGGIYPATGKLTDEKVTMPFAVEKYPQESSLKSQFLAFGDCPGAPGTHILALYAFLENGEKYMFTFDVTDQVHAQKGQKDIYINVSGIDLKDPLDSFGATVDGWIGTDTTVIM